MIKADKHSLAGIILAIFCVAVLGSTGILNPLFANALGRAPRELRLGCELGLIEENQCVNKYLNQSINKRDFSKKLATVMDLIGVQDCNVNTLIRLGIVDKTKMNSTISRKSAVEAMARAIMHISDSKKFNMPTLPAKDFKDYRIPEKYTHPIAYMQNKFVVRGLSNNLLGANRKLTQREAVYFLYRLYEAISSDMMTAIPNDGLCFIDVSLDHPIMESIKDLTAAGAFDRAILRPSFDGDSYLLQDDFTEIIGGIFDRNGKDCDILRLETIFSDGEEYTTRRQMALVLEFLLDSFAGDRVKLGQINYDDVTDKDPEYQALVKLAGNNINPGYGNNIFAANENVTWFEAIKLINQTLKSIGITSDKNQSVNMSAPADKSDFERLKNILIEKKAKIRKILGDNDDKIKVDEKEFEKLREMIKEKIKNKK